MTKIDIFSGFLGAGKTTIIRKLIAEGYKGEKLMLIENEFGEIAIDGGFLKDAGVEITEMNSGCICCTLVGDFTEALKKAMEDYAPDRIIIEPSGVGKLSDVSKAVEHVEGAEIGARVTVVDAGKCRMYMRNFGEFFNDQVENADLIVLSRTDLVPHDKVLAASELVKQLNPTAALITTPIDRLGGEQIAAAIEANGLRAELERLKHEHSHHDHDGHCECGCHDHDDDDDDDDDGDDGHEHGHHHHDHDGHCECGCHDHDDDDDDDGHEHGHHHHDHDGHCECGCHDHDHGHHHHADEVFTSWGVETPALFSEAGLRAILGALEDAEKFGTVLRAKGIVDASDGEWLYFDYVPGETDIRRGAPCVTGRLCVIGSKLKEDALKELFNIG